MPRRSLGGGGIDVLLVLLVIFMAALPMTQRGLDVDLPQATRDVGPSKHDGSIVLEYTADHRISINRQEVAAAELEDRLRRIFQDRRDKTLFIAAAGSLRYRDIIAVVDAAKGAGVQNVGIVTGRFHGTQKFTGPGTS